MSAKLTMANAKSPGWGLRDALFASLLLFSTLLFYLPALNGGFLFDDDRHITPENLRSLHGLWRIWFEIGASFQYYPVLHTVFWIQHRLWGDAVAGYHLTNLLLHFCSACLIVVITRRLSIRGGWLAAFIFALHPLCVDSVAWISELKNTLSTLFYLSAALVYLDFDERRGRWQYSAAFLLFVLSLFTKTVTATLPAALLLIFWWQRGRLSWKRDVAPLVPWFVIGACSGLVSAWMERKFYGAEGLYYFDLTPVDRCLLACRVIFFYLGKVLWPSGLMFHYPLWKIGEGGRWLYLAGILMLLAVLCHLARRNRGPLTAFLFFAGTLVPVLGFFNVAWFCFSYVADHFQYVACLGIIVPFSSGVVWAIRKVPVVSLRRVVWGMVGATLLVLSSLTWHHSHIYADMETLYQDTLARNPDGFMTHYNYGIVLLKIPGRLSDALAQFREALRLNPGDAALYNRVGCIFMTMKGRMPEAIADFETALRLAPDYADAHYSLASALSSDPARQSDAASHYEAALRIKPDFAEAHYGLATVIAVFPDRLREAISHYNKTVLLNPLFAEGQCSLGSALLRASGRVPGAILHYQRAIWIRPNFAEAHYCLGEVLSGIPGREPEAIVHYQEALRLRPELDQIREKLNQLLHSKS